MTEDEKTQRLLAEKRHQEMMEALNKLIELQQQTIELLIKLDKK